MQRGFTPILFLVGIAILVVVAASSYYFGKIQGIYELETSLKDTQNPPQSTPPTYEDKTISADETADWKTFSITPDSSLGYESYQISLPDEWKQIEHSSNFQGREQFQGNSGNSVVVLANNTQVKLSGNLETDAESLIEFEMQYVPGTSYHSPKISNKSGLKLSGQDAMRYDLKLTKPDNIQYDTESLIYLYYKNKLYTIYLFGNDHKTLNKILSTFKFTSP